MRDAGNTIMSYSAAQLLFCYFLVRNSLNHIRSGNKHVGRVFDHDVEISDRGTVDCATSTRPHDATDLRHNTARERVAEENIRVASKAHDAFLNACSTRIIQTDNRCSDLHREIHDLANFFRVSLGKGSAEYSKVLCKNKYVTTVNQTVSGDNTIARVNLLFQSKIF